jgi:hypothetical protein
MSDGGLARHVSKRIRAGILFAAFPAKDLTPYKYFLLLLNRLQRSCEFEVFDPDDEDPFLRSLGKRVVDADRVRAGLAEYGSRVREGIASAIGTHDLATTTPDKLIIVTGAILSDYHYLVRRQKTTLLALGHWEKSMAPPSLAEFLQFLVLRAPFSALEGEVWDTIHLGTRGCIFDFTENLENTRLMALTGVGVCSECAAALARDGYPDAAAEIQLIAGREWRGDRSIAASPANLMERLGYPLFLTKGFEPSWRERMRQLMSDEFAKEAVKFVFAVLIAYLLFRAGWK